MSFMNQDSVDDLLRQVEAQTAAANQAVGGADSAALDVPGDIAAPDIPGPGGRKAGSHEAGDPGLMGEFAPPPTAPQKTPEHMTQEYRSLLAIEVPIIVQLGQRRMTVGEVMRLAVGAIIEFNKSAEEEMDLLANNKPIGRGHAVKVGENFGIKINHVGSIKETIRKLGGQN